MKEEIKKTENKEKTAEKDNVPEEQTAKEALKKESPKKAGDGKAKGIKKSLKDEAISSEIEKLKKALEESNKKADELKGSWIRCAADFENFKKRNAESRSEAYQNGKSDALKSILPIGDNLEHALNTVKDAATKEGLELVIRQFGDILKNMGVEEINPLGEHFDPNLHEAVCQAEPEEGDLSETIKTVFRKGYRLNGKMLRYAQVVVVK